MGSRGMNSMSRSNGRMTRGKMEVELVDEKGRISLDVEDYKGAKGSEIRDFFSSQPYEVHALFNEKDELIDVTSSFDPDRVRYNLDSIRSAIKKDGGAKFTDFHNHPTDNDTIQIFSGKDVSAYVNYATNGQLKANKLAKQFKNLSFTAQGGVDSVSSYMVQTSTGSKFVLSYTGNKTSNRTKTENFAKAYDNALRGYSKTSMSNNQVTQSMCQWVSTNAPKYGFELTESLFVPYKQTGRRK